ncbi:MAG: peptidoglycan DD-metalloendopeptidase family protein [Arenicellales bacterium]
MLEPTPSTTRTPALTHVVQQGDTLYSIAWDAGVDYRALAAWNDISPPYVIRPGETLRLRPRKGSGTGHGKPAVPEPSKRAAAPDTRSGEMGQPEWAWPVRGPIIREFSRSSANPGIDIAGKSGETVKSAADGRVVYAGDGLRGYGELIIVKHNDTFLSAYAHNRKILVREGDSVGRGQPIAEMGSTGTNRVKLHFEIRKEGVAVDPLQYLPKS